MATAQKTLEDYRVQYEEWLQTIQGTFQPSAEKSQPKNSRALKETLSLESEWLESTKAYFGQISEFVRYMRYYRHLYKVVKHQVVFSEADSRITYEYYRTEIQELSKHQTKVDAELSSQIQQLTPKNQAQ